MSFNEPIQIAIPVAVTSGGTGLSSTTANQLLYSSSTSVIAGLATANNGTLVTDGSGVPSISSTLPTAVQGNITSVGNLGNQTNTTRSCVVTDLSTNSTNSWGDGGTYTVIFDNVISDQNSNYNSSTGIFTAPVTGKYLFTAGVALSNNGGLTSSAQLLLTSTLHLFQLDAAAFVTSDPNSYISLAGACIANMTATNTAQVQIIGSTAAGTKSGTIVGQASNPYTYFSAYLIC
jgi:hypothetical protein